MGGVGEGHTFGQKLKISETEKGDTGVLCVILVTFLQVLNYFKKKSAMEIALL